jgi:hypothetical protein
MRKQPESKGGVSDASQGFLYYWSARLRENDSIQLIEDVAQSRSQLDLYAGKKRSPTISLWV